MLSSGLPWGVSVEHGQLERRGPSCYVIIAIVNNLITIRSLQCLGEGLFKVLNAINGFQKSSHAQIYHEF